MLEYGILSGMDITSMSGLWEALQRVGGELLRVATDNPLLAVGIVVGLVILTRARGRGGN